MTRFLVFAPAGDESLQRTLWIAQRTVERLEAEGLSPSATIGPGADRLALEAALGAGSDGLALLCHGQPLALVVRRGEPLLDLDNLHLTRGKWVHAFACSSGVELAARATEQGTRCFVGYAVKLYMDWPQAGVPSEIRELFVRLVTEASVRMARRDPDGQALARELFELAGRIGHWCDRHPKQAPGLAVLAQQLVKHLVFQYREKPGGS